jgi:hypothetical protein
VGNRGGDLGYRGGVGKRSVCHWGGDLGQRSGIGERSSVRDGGGDLGDGGSIGEGCSWRNVSNGGSSDRSSGDGLDGDSSGFFADYSVESVDWVSGVVDSAFGTISLQQRVATLDEVTIALGMRVEVGVNSLSHHSFGNGSSDHCWCRGVGQRSGRCENAGIGGSHEGGKSDELKRSTDQCLVSASIPDFFPQMISQVIRRRS